MVPNETLLCSLKGGRRKRPKGQKQNFWPFWPNFGQIQELCNSESVRFGGRSLFSKMSLDMVLQRSQKEKVNRHKLRIFLIGHIYEVKIIGINKPYVMPIFFTS